MARTFSLNKRPYIYTHEAPRNVHLRPATKPFCIGAFNTKAEAIRKAVRCLRRFGGTARVFHDLSPAHNIIWKRGNLK